MLTPTRVCQRPRDELPLVLKHSLHFSKSKESLANTEFHRDELCVHRSGAVTFPFLRVTWVIFVMQLSRAHCVLDMFFAVVC